MRKEKDVQEGIPHTMSLHLQTLPCARPGLSGDDLNGAGITHIIVGITEKTLLM